MSKSKLKEGIRNEDQCLRCSENIALFKGEHAMCRGDLTHHFYCGPCFYQMLYGFETYVAKDKTRVNCWVHDCLGKFDSDCVLRFVNFKYALEPAKAQGNGSKKQKIRKFKKPSDSNLKKVNHGVNSEVSENDVTSVKEQAEDLANQLLLKFKAISLNSKNEPK